MEEPLKSSPASKEYEVSGKTQIRIDSRFAENEYSCVVAYAPIGNRQVNFEIKDFQQTSQAMTDTMGADLSAAFGKLNFQIGERDELQTILNTNELEEAWRQKSKPQLLEKYADIPDFEPLLDNFGDNLKDARKLLASIKDKGFYGLFFPEIKPLAREELPARFVRTKIIREFMPSIDLPIAENILVRQYAQEIIVEITGELDKDKFDFPKYLELCKQMFRTEIEAENVSFQSAENYFLDKFTLQYKTAARHLHFETKGVYFNDERQQFKPKE